MRTELISCKDKTVDLEGFAAFPLRTPAPLVLLCHAWSGKDDFICKEAERMASLGFIGFALDIYGKGVLGRSEEENSALKKPFLLDRTLLKRRLLKGVERALALPEVTKMGVLGYGFGGLCSLELASMDLPLACAISVYGHLDARPGSKVKILILHGFDDVVTPRDEVLAFGEQMSKDNVDFQLHLFSQTGHAFMHPKSANYNPLSRERVESLTATFLTKALANDIL